ncbi:MAG: ISAzo13-like element transposase-related protein [Nodosilinea sp.]
MLLSNPETEQLTRSQIEDLRLASSKLTGAKRRSFQAEMCLKYCEGSARLAETVFGWNRATVQLGLEEQRSGITCVGAQATASGTKRWEERHPQVAQALRELAESHAQQDPTFSSSIAYTRLTAAEALKQLKQQGFAAEQLPSASTMAVVLNRMGYRLRKVVKAKPQKNSQRPTQFLTTSIDITKHSMMAVSDA